MLIHTRFACKGHVIYNNNIYFHIHIHHNCLSVKELKAVYPLHRCLVDGDGCVFSALSPEIHHQLLGLVDVE